MSFVKLYKDDSFRWGLWEIKNFSVGKLSHAALRKKQSIEANNAMQFLLEDESLEIVKDTFGRPYLKNMEGAISISHSDAWVAVIHKFMGQTGIDVQKFKMKILHLTDKFTSRNEQEIPQNFSPLQWFTLLWTAKESMYKWHGKRGLNLKHDIKILHHEKKERKLIGSIKTENEYHELLLSYVFLEEGVLSFVK